MIQEILKINDNKKIAANVYEMTLDGNMSAITSPGQFVNIKIDGLYLRRPISVCDYMQNSLTLVYKVVGVGTEILSKKKQDDKLDVLMGLGNGYTVDARQKNPLLIGAGVGTPPLYNLAKSLIRIGANVTTLLGFHSKDDVFFEDEFKRLGCKTIIYTSDGSYGRKGRVTQAIDELCYDYVFACGPESMLKSVDEIITSDAQYSFEERMGCGFGACMCCSCKTKYGDKRICLDGPVLKREEVIW